MKIKAEHNNEYIVRTEEEFKNFSEARRHEDTTLSFYANPLKNKIYAVPKTLVDGLVEYYDEMDDPQTEDFDGDGMLKSYHEDERVDEFIRHFVTAYKENTKFRVTVEFVVEADTEEEAEEMVNVGCRNIDYIDCDFVSTEEYD